ncbi:MAG TPA: hypothetical protein PKZ97_14305 [Azospirillaceae bacterium]|nr:hypothetical protein [Azospirillaceae bacterium]HRQ82280.1 hypothetical protein [Azospirillaceae bacterium]
MEETAVIANLPNLEIRVVRRDLPEEGAEVIGVQIKATPSFDAVAADIRRALAPAMASSAFLSPQAFWSVGPLHFWAAAAQMWGPWLAANPFLPRAVAKAAD